MKIKLKSVELVEENNQFYLDAIYDKENEGIKSEIHIPRIEIPFVRSDIDEDKQKSYGTISISTSCEDGYYHEASINLGKGDLPLKKVEGPNGKYIFYTEQYLEREMTVEEIEKQLGYRVKIVGEV